MELVGDAAVASYCAFGVADSRIDTLSGQLASTRADVITLTPKMYALEEVRDMAKPEHWELFKEVWAEAETSEKHTGADQDDALSYYHDVLRSIREIANAADGHNAGHAYTLMQTTTLVQKKDTRRRRALQRLVCLQKGLLNADLESVIETKGLDLQTFPGPASERSTLRAEASVLKGFVEMLGCEERKMMMLTQDVLDLMLRSMEIRADAKNLSERNIELTVEAQEKNARYTLETALLNVVADGLPSVKLELSGGGVEAVNSCWSPHSIVKGASKVKDDVIKPLMAVSEEVADAAKRKVSIVGPELKDTLKQVLTQTDTESKAAILRILAEPESYDSGPLHNTAIYRAVLHNCAAEICCTLLETTNVVVGLDGDTVVIEPGQTEKAELSQMSKGGTETGGTRDQS